MGLCGSKSPAVVEDPGAKKEDAAGGNGGGDATGAATGDLSLFKAGNMTEEDWAAQSGKKEDGARSATPTKQFLKKGAGSGATSSRVENDLVLESVDPSSPRCRVDAPAAATAANEPSNKMP